MKTDSFKTQPVKIIAKEQLTANQYWFKLEYPLKFIPGQFVEISLPGFGEGPVAPCSDPNNQKEFEIVVRAVGSLTKKITELVIGDSFYFRGPYGNGWPINSFRKKDLIIMAGGMGIIPMRSLIHQAISSPHRFGKISLLIGAKNPESFLFKNEFKQWSGKLHYFKTIVDQAPGDYKGRTGVVSDLVKSIPINPKKTIGLICGPEVMCPFCVDSLTKKEIPDKQILLSLERRMKCGFGICQHCNVGKYLVCQDGPIFSWDQIKDEIKK
jgi:NAD(P)H-flavin reductase